MKVIVMMPPNSRFSSFPAIAGGLNVNSKYLFPETTETLQELLAKHEISQILFRMAEFSLSDTKKILQTHHCRILCEDDEVGEIYKKLRSFFLWDSCPIEIISPKKRVTNIN